VTLCLFLGAVISGRWAITFVNGSFSQEIYIIYNILVFKIIIVPYAPLFSQIFINQGRKIQYLEVVKYTFIANVLIVPLFIHFYQGVGMAIAVVIISIFHVMLFLKFRINPN
jgi:hypothetical protein